MARKKRKLASQNSAEDDVNLTPMLDVVFILLIFFIVTAQFIKEPGVEIERTEVDNLDKQNPLGILIAIDENSDIYIDKQQVTLQEIGFRIRELREENPKGKLVLQADKDSEAGVLISLLETINKEDGLTAVPVSVEQE
ncbi:ExbD/TolR family protein [Henriciella mobilis]|uniref:Biopolymer transporter ExbD n=1 Tax=Henriciella mobilis TaxID=2305467 RepID=A0A399RFN6_9PROT|nr:biopolymer transporter ExbD [Henriciella mobilis]RIJ16427.1 biopolymer transporter ExbD [Henriciella mobilis]RIJ22620.1 biopolymer transporter ExbD [Henriciella mobilis]RIJ29341.1 biopolymer transporter ExbD [Henriciella mobilis]